jgi:hypothetical protein
MKKGLSKKLISILLAVLMVVTAVPMTAFASIDGIDGVDGIDGIEEGIDDASKALKTAITAYEDKMNNGTVYTNMTAAYESYLSACKAFDAYVYGDNSNVKLSTYQEDLETKTAAMSEWTDTTTGKVTSKIPTFSYTTETEMQDYSDFYANILYTELCVSGNKDKTDGSDVSGRAITFGKLADTQVELYYPTTVLLYDGSVSPTMPVMVMGKKSANKGRYIYKVYPTVEGASVGTAGGTDFAAENTEFQSLETTKNDTSYGFKGKDGINTLDFDSARKDGTATFSANRDQTQISNNLGYSLGGYWNAFASGFQVTDKIDFGGKGSKTLDLYWAYYGGSSSSSVTVDNNMKAIAKSGHSIYVINYKALVTAINSNKSKIKNISDYTSGEFTELLEGFDTATSLDVANTDYSDTATAVKNVSDKIETAIEKMSSTPTSKDISGYSELRSAIAKTRTTYKSSTASTKYTEETWNDFTPAYQSAAKIMAAVLDGGYSNSTGASTAAATLLDKFNKLEKNFTPADVTKLQEVLEGAMTVINNKGYYTTESYEQANLEEDVRSAKIDVWGSEENYPDPGSVVDIEQQDVVDAWYAVFDKSLFIPKISIDATVSSAKGYSMASAIEYALTFDSTEYANYSAVTQAITNCNNFVPTIQVKQAGATADKLAEYIGLVEDLVNAINNLQPAFSSVKDGTVINAGTTDTTTINYSAADTWTLTWERPNNQVLFRTVHDAVDYDLGTSNFTWYSSRDYDQYLITLNFAASTSLKTGELSSNANYSGTASDYFGDLGAQGTGDSFAWQNFVVTSIASSNGSKYAGKDSNGTGYTLDSQKVWDSELTTVQNDYSSPCSGIITHKGSTTFSANGVLQVSKSNAKNLTLATLPSSKVSSIAPSLGAYFYYKYQPFYVYAGYGYMRDSYSQTATVIDISYLLDLINTVDELIYLDYTESSWNDVETALSAAKAEMNYGSMTVDEITNECVERYTNLYNAWKKLDTPLSNQEITNTVSKYRTFYNENVGKSGVYTTDSWDAFNDAYLAAYNSINGGIYSDVNIRAVDNTDANKSAIAKVAQDVIDAYDALVKLADFSELELAAKTAVESYAYTVSDLQAIKDLIDSSKYLKYTQEQRLATLYDDAQTDIDAETKQITDAFAALTKKEPVDTSVLEAVKDELASYYDDPDAWAGLDEAKEYIETFASDDKLYSPVELYDNVTVYGINYTQDNTDAIITEAKTKVQTQCYDITVVASDGSQKVYEDVPYGTTQEVTSIDNSKVDWYYSYKSNSGESAEKYYTTDKVIRFVVKGDTTLRTVPTANTDDSQYKVTVVNNLKSQVISIDYVNASDEYVLEQPASYPYYEFTGFTVNGKDYAAGDKVTLTANTTVVANYELKDEAAVTLTMYMKNANSSWADDEFEVNYNDLIEVSQSGGLVTSKSATPGSIIVAGEKKNASSKSFRRSSSNDDIYAYAIISQDNYDAFADNIDSFVDEDQYTGEKTYDADAIQGIATIASYGQDYSFYATGDLILVALSKEDTQDFIAAGIANVDENGADVTVKEDLVTSDSKSSIISTYSLPENAKFVEGGILFSKDATADLTFKNIDSKTIYRYKSTAHTVGNQFVISIKNPPTTQTMKYLAYVIYEIDGVQYRIESDAVTATYQA